MILTGDKIKCCVYSGDIEISPFEERYLDPNSYSFHMHDKIIEYTEPSVDSKCATQYVERQIPEEGLLLEPNKFYLGATLEKMGSKRYASELYANLSTATSGMFIQTSAPLGHVGAIINWTLEIVVAQPIRVYPNMQIGKICFWKNFGIQLQYDGRYKGSEEVVPSRIAYDFVRGQAE